MKHFPILIFLLAFGINVECQISDYTSRLFYNFPLTKKARKIVAFLEADRRFNKIEQDTIKSKRLKKGDPSFSGKLNEPVVFQNTVFDSCKVQLTSGIRMAPHKEYSGDMKTLKFEYYLREKVKRENIYEGIVNILTSEKLENQELAFSTREKSGDGIEFKYLDSEKRCIVIQIFKISYKTGEESISLECMTSE